MEKIFGMKSSEFLKMHGTFLGSCNRDRIKSDKHSILVVKIMYACNTFLSFSLNNSSFFVDRSFRYYKFCL